MSLGIFEISISPMILPLIFPLFYSYKYKRKNLDKIVMLSLTVLFIILCYPFAEYLSREYSTLGYFIGKLIVFVIIPFIPIIYFEKREIANIIVQLGIKKEKIKLSITLGLITVIITLVISLIVSWGNKGSLSLYWNTIMFFDSFNEEFLFRGVLLLYLWKLTDIRIAYTTSTLAFILAHPHNVENKFIISTIVQGILLAVVTHKTKNIIGPWISHGLNRVLANIIRAVMF